MNPCNILTSLRGQRGKVVQRMVYDRVMRNVLTNYLFGNAATATAAGGGGGEPGHAH